MSDPKVIRSKKDIPILTVIQQIKDGSLDPSTIKKALRQQCVEVFLSQGYQAPAIQQIFKKSYKTILRDIDDIFEKNKALPDLSLVPRLIGEYMVNCRNQMASLKRLANNTKASVSERVQAEYSTFLIADGMIRRLQAVGHVQPEIHNINHKIEAPKPAVFNIHPVSTKIK
jgi:hypothetical protein